MPRPLKYVNDVRVSEPNDANGVSVVTLCCVHCDYAWSMRSSQITSHRADECLNHLRQCTTYLERGHVLHPKQHRRSTSARTNGPLDDDRNTAAVAPTASPEASALVASLGASPTASRAGSPDPTASTPAGDNAVGAGPGPAVAMAESVPTGVALGQPPVTREEFEKRAQKSERKLKRICEALGISDHSSDDHSSEDEVSYGRRVKSRMGSEVGKIADAGNWSPPRTGEALTDAMQRLAGLVETQRTGDEQTRAVVERHVKFAKVAPLRDDESTPDAVDRVLEVHHGAILKQQRQMSDVDIAVSGENAPNHADRMQTIGFLIGQSIGKLDPRLTRVLQSGPAEEASVEEGTVDTSWAVNSAITNVKKLMLSIHPDKMETVDLGAVTKALCGSRHSLAAARGTGGVVRRIDAELAKMNASPALTPDVATKCVNDVLSALKKLGDELGAT